MCAKSYFWTTFFHRNYDAHSEVVPTKERGSCGLTLQLRDTRWRNFFGESLTLRLTEPLIILLFCGKRPLVSNLNCKSLSKAMLIWSWRCLTIVRHCCWETLDEDFFFWESLNDNCETPPWRNEHCFGETLTIQISHNRPLSTKEQYDQWLSCGKRPALEGTRIAFERHS